MKEDWTELYRPKTLDGVVGNPSAVKNLRQWALAWKEGRPQERAAVLMGPPGVGKTTAAHALANEMGWTVVEMNASDQRNAEAIRNVALRGALSNSFSLDGDYLSSKEGNLKLIILDEADAISGREDTGGIPAISEVIRSTKQPVILIVNDFYELSRRSSVIKMETRQIKFQKAHPASIKMVLRKVAAAEHIEADDKVLDAIALECEGDIRAAVRDLQALSMGRTKIEESALEALGDRATVHNMRDLMRTVLSERDPKAAKFMMMDIGEEPGFVLTWLDENVHRAYKGTEMVNAYECLSRADVFLGRVRNRQNYTFWSYATDLMAYGVTLSKKAPLPGYQDIQFPRFLMGMSSSKGARGARKEVASKFGEYLHRSENAIIKDMLPSLTMMFSNDAELRISLAKELALTQEDAAFLWGLKVDAPEVKALMATLAPPAKPKEEKEKPKPKAKKSTGQATLG
jgi:replication factor C large subunit